MIEFYLWLGVVFGEGFKYKVTPTKDGVNSKLVSLAQELVDLCVEKNNFQQMELELGKKIQTGKFGADMKVALVNDGPVTLIIDSKNKS